MLPYERFEAWQLCHRLTLAVYRQTKSFPKYELYGIDFPGPSCGVLGRGEYCGGLGEART